MILSRSTFDILSAIYHTASAPDAGPELARMLAPGEGVGKADRRCLKPLHEEFAKKGGRHV